MLTVHSLLAQQHLLLQMGQYHGCASLPSNCHVDVRAYVTRVSQCVRAGTGLARASRLNNEQLLSTAPHRHTAVLQTTQKRSMVHQTEAASGSRGASPERGSEREFSASATHARMQARGGGAPSRALLRRGVSRGSGGRNAACTTGSDTRACCCCES